eukprot:1509414-Rhodomonas_salina.2
MAAHVSFVPWILSRWCSMRDTWSCSVQLRSAGFSRHCSALRHARPNQPTLARTRTALRSLRSGAALLSELAATAAASPPSATLESTRTSSSGRERCSHPPRTAALDAPARACTRRKCATRPRSPLLSSTQTRAPTRQAGAASFSPPRDSSPTLPLCFASLSLSSDARSSPQPACTTSSSPPSRASLGAHQSAPQPSNYAHSTIRAGCIPAPLDTTGFHGCPRVGLSREDLPMLQSVCAEQLPLSCAHCAHPPLASGACLSSRQSTL